MKEVIVYEMLFDKTLEYQESIICVPFEEKYWNEYRKIYNECFCKMREALEIEPINVYSDDSQIKNKMNDIFLYLKNEVIAGAVSCYGNELDDLTFSSKKSPTSKVGDELRLIPPLDK